MARASGIGSMPGLDYAESVKIVSGETPELFTLPELPARGVHAGMIGRGLALLSGLGADIVPEGWRLIDDEGIDQRRARSLLAQDLDTAEELLQDFTGAVKIQVAGPWTLAAAVELPRGEKVLSDTGARRDLASSLAEGLRTHIADVRRRFEPSRVVVQIDEPSLNAVLQGIVRTASGLYRYRSIEPPEADAALRELVEAIIDLDAQPVLHSCAPELPVDLLRGMGFTALSFDLGLARALDAWAEAFEAGVDLWPGVVPSLDIENASIDLFAEQIAGFFSRLGFSDTAYAERLVVTPTCGLAGASPDWARKALQLSHAVAAGF